MCPAKIIKNTRRWLSIPGLFKCFLSLLAGSSFILAGCGSGSSGENSPAAAQVQTVNINAGTTQQYTNPNVLSSQTSPVIRAATLPAVCLQASNLTFASSSTLWYVSGAFKISNTCSTAQQLSGTQVVLSGGGVNDTWSGGAFSVTSISPWLGTNPIYTSSSSSNQLILNLVNSYNIPAAQSVSINFGYARNNQALTLAGANVSIAGSIPPPAPSTASLSVAVNSSALASVCTSLTPCNIALNLLDSTNKIYKVISQITTRTGSITANLESLVPGTYTLAATNLPAKAALSLVPASLTLSAGQAASAVANFSLSNPANNCLSAALNPISNGSWWISGSVTLVNNCSTSQPLAGTSIAVNSSNSSDVITSFQLNGTTPYIANFASLASSGNTQLITINSTVGSLAANGSVQVSFGYSPQGKLLSGNLIAVVNGATPSNTANLSITVDSSGLANYCTTATPCNIPLVLSEQGTSYSLLLTTLTTTSAKTVYNISNLNPGSYSVVPQNLPANLMVSYTPQATIQLLSGGSQTLTVGLQLKPVSSGNLSFTLINPQSNVFMESSLAVRILATSGTGGGSVQANFGVLQTTNLAAGNYVLSSQGLASASKGWYYSYPLLNASVLAGATSSLGNFSAQAESNLVTVSIVLNGLATGDIAQVQFSDNKHLFNSESISATLESAGVSTAYKFINGDVVTLNVTLASNYQRVAPVTLTIQANQVYTLNLVKAQTPAQQIVGYFETWQATATWESATYSLANIPSYVSILPLAFAKPDAVYTAGSYNFAGAGLGIAATKDVALGAIKLAQAKGQKILLSVGGATYPNFAAINVAGLMALVHDLGVDGIDLDYEADTNGCNGLNTSSLNCPTDSQMINIITQLRSGLDQLQAASGRKLYLSAAVWSIGAYGSPAYPTTQYGPVGTKSGLWVNPLKQVGNKFDELFLMSYDAGNASSTGYQPLSALKAYQSLFSGPIFLGVEVPPEAWGGNVSTPSSAQTNAQSAAQLGVAGTMIWALQVQGTANGTPVTATSYLQPICQLYNLSSCNLTIPLN